MAEFSYSWFCRTSFYILLRCCSSIQIFGRFFDSRCLAPENTLDSKLSTSFLDSQRCQIRWPNHPKASFCLVQPRLRKCRLPLGFDLKGCNYPAATGAPERDTASIFRFQISDFNLFRPRSRVSALYTCGYLPIWQSKSLVF